VCSPASARTRTVSPRPSSAAMRWLPTKPFPPMTSTSTSVVLGGSGAREARAVPVDARRHTLGEADLGRETKLTPRPVDDEAVLSAEQLDAVAHDRRGLATPGQLRGALGRRTHGQQQP